MIFVIFVSGLMSLGGNSGAGRDTWISAVFVVFAVIPMYFVYYYPIKLYKGSDVFEIYQKIYGKSLGLIINIILILGVFLVFVVSFSRYANFVKTVAMEDTSVALIGIFMVITVIYTTFCGFEVVARFSEIAVIAIILFLVFTLILSYTTLNFENATPILENGIIPVIDGAFSIFTTPYLEMFALICLFSNVKNRNNVTKILFLTVIAGSLVMGIAFLRNLLILGHPAIDSLFYPSYQAISLITLGSFFQRQEVTVSATFLIADIVKLSILSIFICKGVNFIAKKRDYRKFSIVICGFAYICSNLFLNNTITLFSFIEAYQYILVVPFVLIPCVTFLLAIIKTKKRTR